MHHLLAFTGAVPVSSTNANLSTVADGLVMAVSSINYQIPDRWQIRRAYPMGAGLTDCRLQIPTLQAVVLPRVYPVDKGAAPTNNFPIADYKDQGPNIYPGEGFGISVNTDATAGPPDSYALVWATPRFVQAPTGMVFTCKATSSIVTSKGAWAGGSLIMEAQLPAGNYALVGADVYGANVLAGRFLFNGSVLRPGIIAQQAVGEYSEWSQRQGQMGLLGMFQNQIPPNVEVFGLGATATQTWYLDVIRLGA